jgi:hypothetical protein
MKVFINGVEVASVLNDDGAFVIEQPCTSSSDAFDVEVQWTGLAGDIAGVSCPPWQQTVYPTGTP